MEPVAIVGMGVRYPSVDSLRGYWEMLLEGRVVAMPVPRQRWSHDAFLDSGEGRSAPDRTHCDSGAFLDDIDRFAAKRFGIPPRRVEVLDPQHRLLLEVSAAAMDDAGLDREDFERERCGVYVGISSAEYKELVTAGLRTRQVALGEFGSPRAEVDVAALTSRVGHGRAYSLAGSLLNMAAGNVSKAFDLGGPSVAVDAACSSSLVALHQALGSLHDGTCTTALVGGVYLNLVPDTMIGFSRVGAISRSGRCSPFTSRADGFVLGEGAGVVVLKPLEAARRDGDRIYAVVAGSACNGDGRGRGPMTPDVDGQRRVLRDAYRRAGVSATSVGYVEAHGTATEVGDDTEVGALGDVLGGDGAARPLGSVKANIGHTMSAAGIAALIKAALVAHYGVVPPAPGGRLPREDLGDRGLYLPASPEPLRAPDGTTPRIGVSSFGFGGTNVHAVLEPAAAPDPGASGADTLPHLVVLSAETPELLSRHAAGLAEVVANDDDLSPGTMAAALAGRTSLPVRGAVVAATREELLAGLRLLRQGRDGEGVFVGDGSDPGRLAVLVPGQGSQRPGMWSVEYGRFPVFRAAIDAHDAAHANRTGEHLADWVRDPSVPPEWIAETERCQPLVAAVSLSALELFQVAGLRPAVALGHSLGEFTAAASVGWTSPADVMALAARRGMAMADLDPQERGTMVALSVDAQQASELLVDGAWICNKNHPTQTVVGGRPAAVAQVVELARARGVRSAELNVSHAFHTPLVASIEPQISAVLGEMTFSDPTGALVSCNTACVVEDAEVLTRSWTAHASSPVDFVGALQTLMASEPTVCLELGDVPRLTSMVRRTVDDPPPAIVATSARCDDGRTLLEAAARLFVTGHLEHVRPFTGLATGRAAALPPTPLDRSSHWIVAPANAPDEHTPAHPNSRRPVSMASQTHVPATSDEPPTSAEVVSLLREHTALLRSALRVEEPALAGTEASSTPLVTQTPEAASLARSTDADALLDLLMDGAAKVSAYSRDWLRPSHDLIDDLGFDSIMLLELMASTFPEAEDLESRLADVPKLTFQVLARHLADTGATDREPGRTGPFNAPEPVGRVEPVHAVVERQRRVADFPEYHELQERLALPAALEVEDPYFAVHDGIIADCTRVGGDELVSFASYNYLGLSGHKAIQTAARAAIDRYGTSVSASRLLSGEKPIHRELEETLARFIGTEDSIVLVSGHATNVTVIGHLVGPGDLILHDALAHDSILQGCHLSGAVRQPFRHGDLDHLERLLEQANGRRRVLVVVEGVYSMDGDVPDVQRLIELKKRFGALLMIDEAHSIGVLGDGGRGVTEHAGVDPRDVDVLMGTLSKSLSSCGGYIAGDASLVEYLRYTAPGFIYSVGISPPNAAAALASIEQLQREPELVARLQANARLFLHLLVERGIDTGASSETPVIPSIVGDSLAAVTLAQRLRRRGVNVNPILYPAVEEGQARLRFFVTASHTEQQLRETAYVLAEEHAALVASMPAQEMAT